MTSKSICLYADYTNVFSYFNDWLDAFTAYGKIKFHPYNMVAIDNWDTFSKEIENASQIVLLHSLTGDSIKYLNKLVPALKNRKGKLAVFVGNEVNLPTFGMRPKIDILKEVSPDIIASQLLEDTAKWLYKECDQSEILSIPHALNPNVFKQEIPTQKRLKDIGAVSARYNAFLGDKARENILNHFQDNGEKYGLNTDIKMGGSRFDRKEWNAFLNNCKATVATEAGSFYLDRDDKIVKEIVGYVKKQKGIMVVNDDTAFIQGLLRILPKPIKTVLRKITKQRIQPTFDIDLAGMEEEILSKFFNEKNKCPYYSKAISSRHFDAIGAGVLQIMFPGRYNDILTAGEHYVELKHDFSNIDEVISIIKNSEKISQITKTTYQYILNHHTHTHRINYLCSFF